MSDFLYRGISSKEFADAGFQLKPKGRNIIYGPTLSNIPSLLRLDTLGPSEQNAARDHQSETSVLKEGGFISTSKSFDVAKKFATADGWVDGVVVILDRSKFSTYGVIAYELDEAEYRDELEVTIRSTNCGAIPEEVVVDIIKVSA